MIMNKFPVSKFPDHVIKNLQDRLEIVRHEMLLTAPEQAVVIKLSWNTYTKFVLHGTVKASTLRKIDAYLRHYKEANEKAMKK